MERSMTRERHFVLAAGGTGGHMVPAAALAAELARRGHPVAPVSDERGVRFPGLFDGVQPHVLPAGWLLGGPPGWCRAGRNIPAGGARASGPHRTFNAAGVHGWGGAHLLPS